MDNIKEQFSHWKNEIRNHNFKTVYREFQKQVEAGKWSLENEIKLASWCLASANVEAQGAVKNNLIDLKHADDIFLLSKFCCESTAKSWELVSVDFLSVVFYICKHLINSDRIDKALAVGQFVLEYVDARGASAPQKNEVNVPVAFLTLFLIPSNKLELSKNGDTIRKIWNFIFSKDGLPIKHIASSNILDHFSVFVSKSLKNDKYHSDLFLQIKQLSNLMSQFENAEHMFLKFCRTIVYQLCEISEKNRVFFLECLDTFRQNHESTAVSFFGHILQITTGFLKDRLITDLVAESNRELKILVAAQSPVLNDVVYSVTTVLVKMRLCAADECWFSAACATELFELLITLARLMSDIDLNELFNNKTSLKTDIGSVVFLAYLVLYFASTIDGLELGSQIIYQYMLDAEKLVLECTLESDKLVEKKKEQVYYVGGAGCANICRSYMMANLHAQCEELAFTALQYYSHLSAQELSKANLQACIKKLVMSLCNSYRHQQKYTDVLRTSLVWTVIVPTFSDPFMEIFCSTKVKLLSAGEEPILEVTCFELLKTEENPWKHENLSTVDYRQLSLLELKQYLKNRVTSAKPVLKLLSEGSKGLPISEKVQYYVIAAKILTSAMENLTTATTILNPIEKLIRAIQKEQSSARLNEEQRWRNCVLLGDLHYVKFRITLLSARQENESEVKSLKSMSKPPAAEPGMEPEPENDFVPASYTYVSQMEITSSLDAAVMYWRTAAHDLCNRKTHGELSVALELSHIKEAALVYRLYCDVPKEIQTWELLYSAAVSLQDVHRAVDAYSNLLTTPWKINLEWKNVVEEEMLPKVDEVLQLHYQLDYLGRCLNDDFSQKNIESLMKISKERVKEFGMLPKYWFLMARYLYFEIDVKSKSSPFPMTFQALNVIMYYIKERKWSDFAECCQLQCSFFDLMLFMILCDVEKYQVLQAKRYMNESLELIQKLGLPLRTCQFLNVSSRIDALTCQLDDCYVKLAHVCTILNWKGSGAGTFVAPELKLVPAPPSICLSPDFRNVINRNFDPQASPVFSCEHEFTMPEFIYHDSQCKCDPCSNFEYAALFCEAISLFAVYYRLVGKSHIANDYFKGALEMYRIVENRIRAQYNHAAMLRIMGLKVSNLIQYADYWAAKGDYKTAETYNREAEQYLKYVKNPALEREWDEQAWSLAGTNEFKNARKIEAKPKPVVRREKPQPSFSTCKTPAGKLVPPIIPKLFEDSEDEPFTGSITPYPRKSRRALEFSEFCTPKPPSKLRVAKKKSQFNTPPDIVLQTPLTLEKRMKQLDIGSTQKTKYLNKERKELTATNSVAGKATATLENTRIRRGGSSRATVTSIVEEAATVPEIKARRAGSSRTVATSVVEESPIVPESKTRRAALSSRTVSTSVTEVSSTRSRSQKSSDENTTKLPKPRSKAVKKLERL